MEELVSKFIELVSKGNTKSGKDYYPERNYFKIRKNLFNTKVTYHSYDGWGERKIIISFKDIKNIDTYKVESYYDWYDSASDPPFKATSPITKATLKTALTEITR